ncbi:hypothetical protein [Alistipes sp.]|uniref:hypothetical protein n=1 Tax=Alistipes sp. TaxID=1872444 RepID=UPI003AB1EDEA
MKKLLLLIGVCFALCSCVVQYSQTTYLADYRPYSAEGFTISPSSSGFTYESVGDLSIKFIKGVKKGYVNEDADDWRVENIFNPSYEYMVSEMVKEAKALGADALLNFNITPIIKRSKYGETIDGYIASGFAAKLNK